MSNKNYARRTVVKLYFKGADISKELSKYLLSLSFTDKEEDETDDISLSLDDREGKWIKDWLNTSKAVKTKTETVTTGGGEIKVGAIVKFKGGPVYISSMAAEPTVNRGASTCKCTIANHNAHPYHLISQDGQRVYGWCNASDVEGGQATTTTKTTVIKEKKAFKGTEIHAIVIQKNPYSDGKDKVLDCGKFEIDSVSYQGPPQKLTIKATSIPYSTKLRQEKKSKTWENTNLKNIAEKIGKGNSMKVMYLSSHNPSYKRKEQVNTADIVFLKKLCKNAGISLKVTSKTIVLFDEADYEKKSSVKKIKAGKGNILSYSFSTKTADTSYSKCHVSYTDPNTKKTTVPHGNTNYGKDYYHPYERGTMPQGESQRTLTGSGQPTWYHNHDMSGIADINGNLWEWTGGLRLMDGEIQIIPYGNSMKLDCDMSAESTLWKAIKPDGTLVEPGTAGTLKLDQASASAGIRVNTKVEFPTSGDTYRNIAFKSLGAASGVTIPKLLIALGLYPDSGVTGYGNDQIWMRCHGERLPVRGSAFDNTSSSGPSALCLHCPRSSSYGIIGFRSAFVE